MAWSLLFKNKLKESKQHILKEIIMAISISKEAMSSQSNHISFNLIGVWERISGIIWFLLSLVLFVVLGPFSAPIVLIALLQLGCEDSDQVAPKSVA